VVPDPSQIVHYASIDRPTTTYRGSARLRLSAAAAKRGPAGVPLQHLVRSPSVNRHPSGSRDPSLPSLRADKWVPSTAGVTETRLMRGRFEPQPQQRSDRFRRKLGVAGGRFEQRVWLRSDLDLAQFPAKR